ncbi:MAG: NUDIX hydrolase [Planctomycetaceae bacterium]
MRALGVEEEEAFRCEACGAVSPRAFLFDGRARAWFEGEELLHESAGAVIRRGGGRGRRTLLFLRSRYPRLYTIPAGHVEEGAEPEAEMRREVEEETGLVMTLARRLWPDERLLLRDSCRRGAETHLWNAFEGEAEGVPRLSDEGRVVGWYYDEEIRELAAARMLIAPVEEIFRRLGMV